MLYRLNSDGNDFLHLVYDDAEVIEKLGEDNLIQIECDVRAYSPVWKKLNVSFEAAMGGKRSGPIPDLQVHSGHLFLSAEARAALAGVLENVGEILPVTYCGKEGAIFNPLSVLEASHKSSTKNSYGDVTSLFFDSEKLIFKTPFDDYFGVYCSDEFKNLVEAAALTGIVFEKDLSHIYVGDAEKSGRSIH